MADNIPPAQPWSPAQIPPIGGNPVALRPETFARHERAVRYVELMTRELPFTPRRGRTTSPASGTWGWLAGGATISGLSGYTLGMGTVQLCTVQPQTDNLVPGQATSLTVDGDIITVYNYDSAITAPDAGMLVRLLWTQGVWTVDPGALQATTNCQCQDGPYIVECNCGGACQAYYSGGTPMPGRMVVDPVRVVACAVWL